MAHKNDAKDHVDNVFSLIKEHNIQFVDFRFTDPKGKWQHTAYSAKKVEKESFEDGIMFDGSSIAGWKSINESDMILMPDLPRLLSSIPFSSPAHPHHLFCDVVDPVHRPELQRATRAPPPRSAEQYLAYTKSARRGRHGRISARRLEFFIFDDVRYKVDRMHESHGLQRSIPIEAARQFRQAPTTPRATCGHRPGP